MDQLAEALKGYGWKAGIPVWPQSQEPDIEHAQPLPGHRADPDACYGDQDEAVHDDNPGNKARTDLQDGPGHSALGKMESGPAVHSIDNDQRDATLHDAHPSATVGITTSTSGSPTDVPTCVETSQTEGPDLPAHEQQRPPHANSSNIQNACITSYASASQSAHPSESATTCQGSATLGSHERDGAVVVMVLNELATASAEQTIPLPESQANAGAPDSREHANAVPHSHWSLLIGLTLHLRTKLPLCLRRQLSLVLYARLRSRNLS
ncbi:hypothetical protein C8Q74DRAFT_404610 [Fomes fomentarius]|nr:hypothetical protein C8Q74DRAFT_404610 [Fomes fomentarius]